MARVGGEENGKVLYCQNGPGDVRLQNGKKCLLIGRCGAIATLSLRERERSRKRVTGASFPPGAMAPLRVPGPARAREVTRGERAGAGGVAGCRLWDFLNPERGGSVAECGGGGWGGRWQQLEKDDRGKLGAQFPLRGHGHGREEVLGRQGLQLKLATS